MHVDHAHFVLVLVLVHYVNANTEIRNFKIPEERRRLLFGDGADVGAKEWEVDDADGWYILSADNNEKTILIDPAPLDSSFDDMNAFCSTVPSTATNSTTSSSTSMPSNKGWLNRALDFANKNTDASNDDVAVEVEGDVVDKLQCSHGMLFCLDTNGKDGRWAKYDSFSLRLSWLASTPADFDIRIIDDPFQEAVNDPMLAAYIPQPQSSQVRSKSPLPRRCTTFALIRAIDTGVLAPRRPHAPHSYPYLSFYSPLSPSHAPSPSPSPSPSSSSSSSNTPPSSSQLPVEPTLQPLQIPVTLHLTPLLLSAIPLTLLPLLFFTIPVMAGAVLTWIWWVKPYLDEVAREAGREMGVRGFVDEIEEDENGEEDKDANEGEEEADRIERREEGEEETARRRKVKRRKKKTKVKEE